MRSGAWPEEEDQARCCCCCCCWVAQSCPTLCNPVDGSPPGSPIPGILQARTLEWVAISFSNAWKWKVKVKSLSRARLLATPWTAAYQAPPSMGFSRQEYWTGVPLPSPLVSLQTRCLIFNWSLYKNPWLFPSFLHAALPSRKPSLLCLFKYYPSSKAKNSRLPLTPQGSLFSSFVCSHSTGGASGQVPRSSPGWSRVFEGETASATIYLFIHQRYKE